MLKQRVITALLGIPLVIAIIWFGEPWFTIFMAIWGVLAVFEFYRLVAASKVPPNSSATSPHREFQLLSTPS